MIQFISDVHNETVVENLLSKFPTYPNQDQALLPVRVDALHKGVTDNMSLICIPSSEDIANIVKDIKTEPMEPSNVDRNHVRNYCHHYST